MENDIDYQNILIKVHSIKNLNKDNKIIKDIKILQDLEDIKDIIKKIKDLYEISILCIGTFLIVQKYIKSIIFVYYVDFIQMIIKIFLIMYKNEKEKPLFPIDEKKTNYILYLYL